MTTEDLVAILFAWVDLIGCDLGERQAFSRAVI